MGCDIHGFIEIQRPDGFWELSDEYEDLLTLLGFDGRAYLRWALIAGVRNRWRINTVAEGRGLPPDICDEGAELFERSSRRLRECLHSQTWVVLAELATIDFDEAVVDDATIRDLLGPDFPVRLTQIHDRAADPTQVRLVCWFDN